MTNTKRPAATDAVTRSLWTALEAMYAYFNATLFGGQLLPVVLNFSRHANSYGFFAPDRWVAGETTTHEISINPTHLMTRELRATASTLVHEMAHCWQQEHGTPGKRGYHNEEWAAKMDTLGLMPTSTGRVGGARTGYRMTHMIIDGGAYDLAFAAMPDACKLPWLCVEGLATAAPTAPGALPTGGAGKSGKTAPVSKVKFTCPGCKCNAWGKPTLRIACIDCVLPMLLAGAPAPAPVPPAPVPPAPAAPGVEVDAAVLAAAAEHVAAELARAGRDLATTTDRELAALMFAALESPEVYAAAARGAQLTSAGELVTRRLLDAIEARA